MQNIGASNAGDEFYRYKMPKLVAKIEGRGNGIKTNVVNCVDIAKSLERPTGYVLKYFGCELGAQTKLDEKQSSCIVNGAHDAKKLSEVLEGFIKKYVQCYSCGNPETVVKIRKECIHLKCKACGFTSDVDMRHKLNTYILKNPPESKLSKNEAKVKKAEKEKLKELAAAAKKAEKEEKKKEKEKRKAAKKAAKEANGEAGDDDDDKSTLAEGSSMVSGPADDSPAEEEGEEDDDDVEWLADTSETAAVERAKEQLSAASAAMVTGGDALLKAQQEEEAAKKKAEEEAEAKKKAEEEEALAERLKKLELAGDGVRTLREALDDKLAPADLQATLKGIKVKGKAAGRALLLWQAVMDFATGHLHTELEKNAAYFNALGGDMTGQAAIMVAYEKYLGELVPEKQNLAPHVLKTMYELEIVDEEVICLWWETKEVGAPLKVSAEAAEAIRKVTEPVYTWLKEAESDSEDDE